MPKLNLNFPLPPTPGYTQALELSFQEGWVRSPQFCMCHPTVGTPQGQTQTQQSWGSWCSGTAWETTPGSVWGGGEPTSMSGTQRRQD